MDFHPLIYLPLPLFSHLPVENLGTHDIPLFFARGICQIHDEVILEGPEATAKEALAETVRCMEHPWDGVGLKELRVSRSESILIILFLLPNFAIIPTLNPFIHV